MPALAVPLLLALLQAPPPRDAVRPRAAAGTASVSGRVYSAATGAPIRSALVTLAPGPLTSVTSVPARSEALRSGVATDADGRFSLSGVAAGSYYVIAMPSTASGRYLPAGHAATYPNDPGTLVVVSEGADLRNVDIGLPSSLAIEGRVMDEMGEPLSRVAVFAGRYMPGSDISQRIGGVPIQTDDLGRYRLYGLEPGNYVVAADGRSSVSFYDPSFNVPVLSAAVVQRDLEPFALTFHPSTLDESRAQRVRVTAQDVSGIDIVLLRSRPLTVAGMILDSRGEPAASTPAALMRRGLALFDTRPLQTDGLGRFRATIPGAGEYRLLVGSGMASGLGSVNGRTEFAEVQLSIATDTSELVVVTQPGIGLAGQVVFAEAPPANAPPMKIALRRPEGRLSGTEGLDTTMDDALRFYASDVFGPYLIRVSGLPTGWAVKAVTLGGADITDIPTAFTTDHEDRLHVVLSSRVAALDGEVRGEGPMAAGSATVYVFAEDRSSWRMSSPRTRHVEVGENGKFRVGDLAAGRYYAVAIARAGFRLPPQPGETFFELLSKEATPFVVGEDERRTLELQVLRWPE